MRSCAAVFRHLAIACPRCEDRGVRLGELAERFVDAAHVVGDAGRRVGVASLADPAYGRAEALERVARGAAGAARA